MNEYLNILLGKALEAGKRGDKQVATAYIRSAQRIIDHGHWMPTIPKLKR